MLTRRHLLAGTLAAFTAPRAAAADNVPRIGYLAGSSAESQQDLLAAFNKGMQDLGYGEGSFVIDARYTADRRRLPDLAAELVRRRVNVVLLAATALPEAAGALGAVPTVFIIADDPVEAGLIATLARPGGHRTGLSSLNIELDAKRLEMLKEALPGAHHVAVLTTPQDRTERQRVATSERAARSLDLRLDVLHVSSMKQLESAIVTANSRRVEAVAVVGSPVLRGYSAETARLLAKARLAAISAWPEFAKAGGLLSYGTNVAAMFHRAAVFVDKILKGANPGDLPVEQARTFDLVINLKTAKALGLGIPPSLLARAVQVIE